MLFDGRIHIPSMLTDRLLLSEHENTWAFVTHGGTMAVQEAVTFGVPFVGIPFFSDQPRNVRNCADKEVAVYLDYENLNADNLVNAVKTVIEDPKYR